MTITTARPAQQTTRRHTLRHNGSTHDSAVGSRAVLDVHGTAVMPVTAVPPTDAHEPRAGEGVTPDGRALASWAARIDVDGIAAHEDLARRLVTAASRRGLNPVLVDVLADPAEPSVARERAFGRLALALSRTAA